MMAGEKKTKGTAGYSAAPSFSEVDVSATENDILSKKNVGTILDL